MTDINMNQLRDRSIPLPTITDEMYLKCSEWNRSLINDFFEDNPQLSKETKRQYISGMRHFLWFVHLKLGDKPWYEISKRDFTKYLSYLMDHKMSSSTLGFKKSSVSTVCEYILDQLAEEDFYIDGKKVKVYETFRNFTKGKNKIVKNQVYNKIAISEEEYTKLLDELQKEEDYLGMAWVACAYATGSRRSGIIQFKTEILDKEIEEGQEFIKTNIVREKGAGQDGNQTDYILPVSVIPYLKQWVDNRGYESEWIFTTRYRGEIKQMSKGWANDLCKKKLSKILGRRINPHLFKASAVSYYLAKGMSLKFVSSKIAHHRQTSTTTDFYDLRGGDDQINDEFKKLK